MYPVNYSPYPPMPRPTGSTGSKLLLPVKVLPRPGPLRQINGQNVARRGPVNSNQPPGQRQLSPEWSVYPDQENVVNTRSSEQSGEKKKVQTKRSKKPVIPVEPLAKTEAEEAEEAERITKRLRKEAKLEARRIEREDEQAGLALFGIIRCPRKSHESCCHSAYDFEGVPY